MLVVYLSNRYIRVVDGEVSGSKVNVRAMYYSVDTRGCILNGTVMDAEGFTELIRNLWDSNHLPRKGVSLVIDSNQFTTKVTDVPLQKQKQMMQFVSREFTDVERIEDPVYGYFPLPGQTDKKAKVQTVFATMAPRAYIQGYVELFEQLGISVENVESARGAVLRMVGMISQIKGETCIVQFVDDMTLINVLLYQGLYVYSGRNRLFADPGTVDFSVEIARSVSNILQFAQAQNIPEKVKMVYIAGLEKEDMQIYADSVRQIDSEIQAEWLKSGNDVIFRQKDMQVDDVSKYAIPSAGLIRTDSKTSLMSQIVKDPAKAAKKKKRRKVLVPVIVLAVILLGAVAVLGGRTLYLSGQLKDAKEYNNRADILKACDKYDKANDDLHTVGALNSSLEGLRGSVLAYPRVDSATEQTVASCAAGLVTAEISSYNSVDGVLSFSTSAANVEQIHQFIDLLSQQPIFAAVDYTGYTQDSEGQWNVKVNCMMANRQEEGNDAESD